MAPFSAQGTFLALCVEGALAGVNLHEAVCSHVEFASAIAKAAARIVKHLDESSTTTDRAFVIFARSTIAFFFVNRLQLSYNTILWLLTVHYSGSVIIGYILFQSSYSE